jgi:ATP-binding cassette subfamily C protein
MQMVREAETNLEESTESKPALDEALNTISIQNISFSYPNAPVLNGLSLTLQAGEFVTVVGPSGAGKTTLLDILLGLYRPSSGEVFINSRALGEIDLKSWRKRIGYVPQETLLFHDSVMRNVTLGDPTLTETDVWKALEQAGADTFVRGLPEGMDTVLGERGAKLSGGQRQRIAIARALVTGPELLVLDEATTALDPATEAGICETLQRLRGRITILAVSHQSALQEAADYVLELLNGTALPRNALRLGVRE